MADQHEIPQPLVFDDAKHIGNVQGEIDARAKQMRTLAETGVRRGEHAVPAGAQPVGHALPCPAAMPGTVYEDEGLGVSGLHVLSASSLFGLHALKTWMRGSSPRMTTERLYPLPQVGVACGKAGNGLKPQTTAHVSGIGPETPQLRAYARQNDSALNPCASRPSFSMS
jgi:hypothetical protein